MGYLWLRGALISTSAYVGDTHRWVTVNAFSGQNYNTYDRKFGYTVSNTTGGPYTYSIKASGAASSARYIIDSDERIKKDIVDVEDDEALVKLRKLHPKKYRFIDESAQGAHQVYGYLANEVQEVLPDAVVEHTNEIPSIYQFANASSNVITFSGDFDTSQLESNVLVVIGVDQVKHTLTVDDIIEKPFTQKPQAPFITSTLQQEGSRKLRFTAKRTLRVAQRLYENGYILLLLF